MLRQPDIADALGNEGLDQIIATGARLVVSANIGCLLQLQARARHRGVDLEIVHPLELLLRQLA
jgi:glycolate oxidase iron-sulfur subunit